MATKRQRKAPRRFDGEDTKYMAVALRNSLLETTANDADVVVPECPAFHPTAAQWADPLAYIASIAHSSSTAGIARIVPPAEWAPPRVPLPPTKFPTKLQRVDKLQQGVPYDDGKDFSPDGYNRMADAYVAESYPELVIPSGSSVRPNGKMPLCKMEAPETAAVYNKIEETYWKVVAAADTPVAVQYGNDLECIAHGSGFPLAPASTKREAFLAAKANSATVPVAFDSVDYYRRTGWNLHNLPHQRGSVLASVASEVDGVNVPWLYHGMLFSTFAWHTEDNYFYSINYMHEGAPKTWYGIPSRHAEKFEDVMKSRLLQRFEDDKDLLFHLTTVVPPKTLVKAGVDVHHARQRPGEFIITFPQGYHSGFSLGANMAEACNFALADWIPFGRKCLNRYRAFLKSSTIVHEQLMLKLHLAGVVPDEFFEAFLTEWQYLVTQELRCRKAALKAGVMLNPYPGNIGVEDCVDCNQSCYLSKVQCRFHPAEPTCGRHYYETCTCSPDVKVLYLRLTDDQLNEVVASQKEYLAKLRREKPELFTKSKSGGGGGGGGGSGGGSGRGAASLTPTADLAPEALLVRAPDVAVWSLGYAPAPAPSPGRAPAAPTPAPAPSPGRAPPAATPAPVPSPPHLSVRGPGSVRVPAVPTTANPSSLIASKLSAKPPTQNHTTKPSASGAVLACAVKSSDYAPPLPLPLPPMSVGGGGCGGGYGLPPPAKSAPSTAALISPSASWVPVLPSTSSQKTNPHTTMPTPLGPASLNSVGGVGDASKQPRKRHQPYA